MLYMRYYSQQYIEKLEYIIFGQIKLNYYIAQGVDQDS